MSFEREAWRRVKAIAGGAWALPAPAREAFVESLSGNDAALKHEVLSLLDSMELAGDRFETPALASAGGERAARRAIGADRLPAPGSRIGPWRISRELGHGGMGTVYLVERIDAEFSQRGALKVIRGLADDELLRRFRDERRILAGLEHPHITRLLDGGATPDGLPFVVMEYVEGVPIDAYCDERSLGVRDRIELFQKVCAAVQYAHHRLIIHRDIKAGNILVATDGTPKLLDFGIAKLVAPGGGGGATRLRAHTTESASPEQILGEPITVAADVYALGVLLYRLLSGASPYGEAPNETALVRAICEGATRPPSVAARSASTPGRGRIEPDLDLIVLEALRREPERRYSSVEQFAADLSRYLAGRPVVAAADSWSYRTRKWFRRHLVLATVSGAALVGIVGGAGVAVYQAHVAREQRAIAARRFADVRKMANSFLFEFHDAIADLPGSLQARQLVVKRATEYLDELAGDAREDVALQRELATAHERLAAILGGGGVSHLGDLKGAEQRYLTALAIRERLAGRADSSLEDVDALAELQVQLARFFSLKGDLARAEQQAAAAVALLQLPRMTGLADVRVGHLATALHQLGYAQARRAENGPALASLEQSVVFARQQADAHPGDLVVVARLARIQIDAAQQKVVAGRTADALAMFRDAQHGLEQLLERDPRNARYRGYLVELLNDEGDAFIAAGDEAGARAAFTRAVAMAEALLADGPDDQGHQIAAMMSHYSLGAALIRFGDTDDGIRRFRQAIAEAEAMARTSPDSGFVIDQLASVRAELGEALIGRRPNDAEGCRLVGDALTLWNRVAASSAKPRESSQFRGKYERMWTRCHTSAAK